MSEYQFVHFLAMDKPLTGEQLEFMNQQSTRADISQWEFTNERTKGTGTSSTAGLASSRVKTAIWWQTRRSRGPWG